MVSHENYIFLYFNCSIYKLTNRPEKGEFKELVLDFKVQICAYERPE